MMPSCKRLLDLEVVRRHALARAAIDDDRLGRAQPLGGARGIDGGIAAAVNHDAPAEQRLVFAFHRPQHGDGIENFRGRTGGNIGALADMGADGEKCRIEAAGFHAVDDAVDFAVELQHDAKVENSVDLGIEHVARQTIFGNSEAHHAAGKRTGLMDLDRMTHAPQVIGRGQARRTGADDQHALAAVGLRRREFPAVADRRVAEETLDRIDADRFVDMRAIAGVFAGVIADPAHHRRHRVVERQCAPGGLVVAGLGVVEPGLNIFAGRTGVVAGRQPIDIDRPRGAPRSGQVGEAGADIETDCEGMIHQASPSSSIRWYSAMFLSAIACSNPTRASCRRPS